MFTWLTVLGLVGALVAAGGLFYLYQTTTIPDPNSEYLTQTTQVFYADGKEPLGDFAIQDRQSIALEDMPQHLQDAVVAAEDQTFWTNRGIDPKGIARAFWNNLRGGPTQGASTITQQYVKILYLTSERTLSRKLTEAMVSIKLQNQQDKRQILEGYLNTIYFGRGSYGAEAAANAFFAKDAKDLTLKECAVLASVLNNPTKFDPANGKENRRDLKARYQYVLNGMVEMGTLDSATGAKAERKLPTFPEVRADSKFGGQKGHMLKLVKDELKTLGFDEQEVDGGGLRITTTFTPQAMRAVQDGVLSVKPDVRDRFLHIGAAAVEPGTGALVGFYGGQDYLDSQINWAVAGGMAGSTFKAFTDAAAISQGYSLKDTFEGNSPIELPDGTTFENQGDQDYGSAVSMIKATQSSINTAFIDMVASMDNGPAAVIKMAEALGIPGNEPGSFGIPRKSIDLQENVGVTLGTAQVSPINMANAYATIANGGERAPVHVISKVVSKDGEELYSYKAPTKRVLDEDIAADVSFALQQVVTSEGSGRQALALNRPAAGKTGTATNDKDEVSSSWFVGYTPQMSTAVMYVRGNGRQQLQGWLPDWNGLGGYFGGNYPTRTWTAIMQTLMEGLPVEEFPEPVYVDGDAPTSGHEPTMAPPTSVRPTQRPTKRPTRRPTTRPPTTPTTSAPTSQPPTTLPPTTTVPTTAPPSSEPPTSGPPTTLPPTDGGSGAAQPRMVLPSSPPRPT